MNTNDNLNPGNVVKRFKAPTPEFWKKVRNSMIAIGSVGAAILALPASIVVLPAALLTAAGYMIAVGTVGATLSQATRSEH